MILPHSHWHFHITLVPFLLFVGSNAFNRPKYLFVKLTFLLLEHPQEIFLLFFKLETDAINNLLHLHLHNQ